uniref:NR LBD domain-containing protein n=1 Tax=Panagrolaimus sp. ES5 TaxID=591445 RepID=A0AC34FFC0_9BILA
MDDKKIYLLETIAEPCLVCGTPTPILYFQEPSFIDKDKFSSNNSRNICSEFSKLLESYIESRKPKTVLVHYLKADAESYNGAQGKEYIKIAQLLNLYEPFSTLNANDKNLLFKKFWEIFSGLEKFYQSCLYFGNNPKDVRVALWSYYIDYDEIIRDANDVIPGDADKAFLIPMLYKARKIFKLFKKLNITIFELAYMSQIALWSCYDILGLSKATQIIAEEMLEKASNEMHEYFVNELRIPYYATRQSHLFKIVQNIEINVNGRRQMFLAKDIFNFGSNANEENDFFNQYYKYIKKQ